MLSTNRQPALATRQNVYLIVAIVVGQIYLFFICSLSKSNKMSMLTVSGKFWREYTKTTPKKLKIIDAYLFYVFLTGVIQFVYCCMVGTFPFNSFLSGFISCISSFVLGGNAISFFIQSIGLVSFVLICTCNITVCLRLQVNPQNKSQFSGISPERGFADFIFAHIILHIVVMNFIG